jgi:hypothetical protein
MLEMRQIYVALVATAELRSRLRMARGELPFFDRGPGYDRLAGRDHEDVGGAGPTAKPRPETLA